MILQRPSLTLAEPLLKEAIPHSARCACCGGKVLMLLSLPLGLGLAVLSFSVVVARKPAISMLNKPAVYEDSDLESDEDVSTPAPTPEPTRKKSAALDSFFDASDLESDDEPTPAPKPTPTPAPAQAPKPKTNEPAPAPKPTPAPTPALDEKLTKAAMPSSPVSMRVDKLSSPPTTIVLPATTTSSCTHTTTRTTTTSTAPWKRSVTPVPILTSALRRDGKREVVVGGHEDDMPTLIEPVLSFDEWAEQESAQAEMAKADEDLAEEIASLSFPSLAQIAQKSKTDAKKERTVHMSMAEVNKKIEAEKALFRSQTTVSTTRQGFQRGYGSRDYGGARDRYSGEPGQGPKYGSGYSSGYSTGSTASGGTWERKPQPDSKSEDRWGKSGSPSSASWERIASTRGGSQPSYMPPEAPQRKKLNLVPRAEYLEKEEKASEDTGERSSSIFGAARPREENLERSLPTEPPSSSSKVEVSEARWEKKTITGGSAGQPMEEVRGTWREEKRQTEVQGNCRVSKSEEVRGEMRSLAMQKELGSTVPAKREETIEELKMITEIANLKLLVAEGKGDESVTGNKVTVSQQLAKLEEELKRPGKTEIEELKLIATIAQTKLLVAEGRGHDLVDSDSTTVSLKLEHLEGQLARLKMDLDEQIPAQSAVTSVRQEDTRWIKKQTVRSKAMTDVKSNPFESLVDEDDRSAEPWGRASSGGGGVGSANRRRDTRSFR